MATLTISPDGAVDFSDSDVSYIFGGRVTVRTSGRFVIDYGDGDTEEYLGTGFTYGSDGYPVGGVLTDLRAWSGADLDVNITGANLQIGVLLGYARANNAAAYQAYLFSADDHIVGQADTDVLYGHAGNDFLEGYGGADTLYGQEGDDVLDGGAGLDIARYAKALSNYSLTHKPGDRWAVVDKTGAEGVDELINIETIKFSDRSLNLKVGSTAINTANMNILRVAADLNDVTVLVGNGAWTTAKGVAELVVRADATTSVATLSYAFFTGKIPSQGGIDYLVSPTGPNPNSLNSAYYQSFNLENRYINFAVNLGRDGEGKAGFAQKYGGLSLFDSTREAYKTIFGGAPTDAKVHALIDSRVDYFSYYGGDGPSGQGTKAAMVGWLLAEAVKADIGQYSKANDAFLTDLADGAIFAVDLVGVYGKADYNYAG